MMFKRKANGLGARRHCAVMVGLFQAMATPKTTHWPCARRETVKLAMDIIATFDKRPAIAGKLHLTMRNLRVS